MAVLVKFAVAASVQIAVGVIVGAAVSSVVEMVAVSADSDGEAIKVESVVAAGKSVSSIAAVGGVSVAASTCSVAAEVAASAVGIAAVAAASNADCSGALVVARITTETGAFGFSWATSVPRRGLTGANRVGASHAP